MKGIVVKSTLLLLKMVELGPDPTGAYF